MSSTQNDRPEAITLTDAERDALIDHAARDLGAFAEPGDLAGNVAAMVHLAEALTRAARLTLAAREQVLPPELRDMAQAGLPGSIDSMRDHAEYERSCLDRWRGGDADWGWPELTPAENEERLTRQAERAAGELAALESLAAKIGGAA